MKISGPKNVGLTAILGGPGFILSHWQQLAIETRQARAEIP